MYLLHLKAPMTLQIVLRNGHWGKKDNDIGIGNKFLQYAWDKKKFVSYLSVIWYIILSKFESFRFAVSNPLNIAKVACLFDISLDNSRLCTSS